MANPNHDAAGRFSNGAGGGGFGGKKAASMEKSAMKTLRKPGASGTATRRALADMDTVGLIRSKKIRPKYLEMQAKLKALTAKKA